MRTPAEIIAEQGSNPLTAFYDADPAGWKPYFYSEFVDLNVLVNSEGTMVFQTTFAPFIWTHTTHGIVGNIYDPTSSGLYNDGQYLVMMSDERTNYIDAPVPANLAFGPHQEGEFSEMPQPIFFPANHAVRVELRNLWTRTLTPVSETFRVYFCLRGIQYWGQLKPPRELLKMSQGE